MSAIISHFISTLEQETLNSEKYLSLFPVAQQDWKPHERSMSVGRLAYHIASLPRWIRICLSQAGFDFAQPSNLLAGYGDEVLPLTILKAEAEQAKASLQATTEEELAVLWRITMGDQLLAETPRHAVIQREMNHMVHHRGQLSVYYRLLGIPLPNIYGPTADDKRPG